MCHNNLKFTNYSTTNTHARVLLLKLHNKSTIFTWNNFSNHTRRPFVELRLQIRVPSAIVWYINIHMNRTPIHSKLQFACVCVYSQTLIRQMCDQQTHNHSSVRLCTRKQTWTLQSKLRVCDVRTAALPFSADVTTGFDHLQMWIVMPSLPNWFKLLWLVYIYI